MPDYNLENIVSTGNDLIQIGFGVEGYEVENINSYFNTASDSMTNFGSNAIQVTPGGYIDDESAKQQVLNWITYGSFIVTDSDGKSTMVKNRESRLGLPDILDGDKIDSKKSLLQRNEFIIGIALPANNIDNYISHFYSDFSPIPNLGEKLINSKLLRAQLAFCQNGSGVSIDVKVVDFCDSGMTDTCQIDSHLLVCTPLKSNFNISLFDNTNKEYQLDGSMLKGAVLGDYNIDSASINGLTIDAMKLLANNKMDSEQFFNRVQAGSTYGTTLRMRLYVEKSDLDAIQSACGGSVPEGMVGKPTPYYNEVVSAPQNAGNVVGCMGMVDAAEKWHNVLVNSSAPLRYSNDGYSAIQNTGKISFQKSDGSSYTPNYISSNGTFDCSGLVSLMLMDAGVMNSFVKANSTGFCSKGFGGIEKNLKPGYQIKEIPISQVQKGDIIASTGTQAGGANNLSPQLGINTHRTDGAGNGVGGSKFGHVAVYYGGGRVTGIGGTKQKSLDGNFNEKTYRIALRVIQTS